ncbi:alkanesulfonate monooxygenase SsuD/methylene tetrahydromethanopterin reductase-like flavin-dependent oxidoreductase (luciferase family) [Rhodococcus rhodochrous J45]|uniref:Alkanesulfonate monooxygenase SsuD/methylene tetrahydromethanopterin reductase-like flavin-dependent oxidoreductase (Luciferase family) n=1 Tax=Rhodococcus rhodochrous J45 TaxID=935266 RepID=A0A562ETN2_RHORH|nr:LLM class flavin-dependent oxidoreductase [Rhodococcus rhodochrous]TWH25001.1 alkanesulfonate monooxygenase SsuD/methylene tetrahydromethanopterin reductase-like flavin-dependent oxidoreductase (luciferase family) [Rhodococcus rhodochrous J45]
MELGVILGDVHTTLSPREHLDGLLRQVDAAQRNGVRYIVMGHHYLYGNLRWLQPIPTLARIAAELDPGVRIGTMVVQAPLFHPVALAEELATLDILTRGRLVVGVGAGYRREEFAAFGVDFDQRFAMMDEALQIVRLLWTRDEVTFHGRFWTLDDVRTHIRPWQQPHPPIWIGALRDSGVRRSARLGDAWPVTPETRTSDMKRMFDVYAAARRKHGRPPVPRHPLRREIVPGRTSEAAFDRFEAMARDRLLAYAQRELATRDARALREEFREVARREAIIGTPYECLSQLRDLAGQVPVDPVIVRAQWPDMSSDDVVAYLDDLGRDIVPGLNEIVSIDARASENRSQGPCPTPTGAV